MVPRIVHWNVNEVSAGSCATTIASNCDRFARYDNA
jgi:hypothetical protein